MRARPPAGTPVCALDDLPEGSARMFGFAVEDGTFRLLVLRSGDQCYGYENYCPHFGVPLAERDEQLILSPHKSISCNTHYARFRWHDGFCEFGDCEGESLVPVPLTLQGGLLYFS